MSQNDLDILKKEHNEWDKKILYNYKEHVMEVDDFFEKIENYVESKISLSPSLDNEKNERLKWMSMFGCFKGLIKAQCENNRELFKTLRNEMKYLHL